MRVVGLADRDGAATRRRRNAASKHRRLVRRAWGDSTVRHLPRSRAYRVRCLASHGGTTGHSRSRQPGQRSAVERPFTGGLVAASRGHGQRRALPGHGSIVVRRPCGRSAQTPFFPASGFGRLVGALLGLILRVGEAAIHPRLFLRCVDIAFVERGVRRHRLAGCPAFLGFRKAAAGEISVAGVPAFATLAVFLGLDRRQRKESTYQEPSSNTSKCSRFHGSPTFVDWAR